MENITVHLPARPAAAYDAIVERGLLARAGDFVRPLLAPGARAILVTSPIVRRLCATPVETACAAADLPLTVLELPDGERFKRLHELESLAVAMVNAGADRHALVLALGGGVVGDVAAFLASIYMRGLDLIQIPTTLVAMIDSALGGKTGVNLTVGKNLLGTFHHPRAVLVDPGVLATLPPREFRSGMAEAVKYGVIGDPALFELIEAHPDMAGAAPDALDRMIAACLRQKAAVVAADEREGGLRRILNFGHTLGHALESATGYEHFLHGEAVAWGMIAAAHIARRRGAFPAHAVERLAAVIGAACGPLPPIPVDPATILRHAASDKKARAGVLHFVLPTAIGAVEVVNDVAPDTVLAALADTLAGA